ncbi:hypothetical protein UKMH10_4718 [Burkholderia pseudomallei]|nr:unnamed protein product [Burkholderia pseudomallei]VUD66456.1 hypothetical protein UKMH10_4718 [Burkholderia pseudomallei]
MTRAAARAGRFARRPARRPARGGFRKVHGARVAAVRSREAPLRAALIRVLTRAVIGDECAAGRRPVAIGGSLPRVRMRVRSETMPVSCAARAGYPARDRHRARSRRRAALDVVGRQRGPLVARGAMRGADAGDRPR